MAEIKIGPPKRLFPYHPPPEIMKRDIEELLKEIDGLKYGVICERSPYPVVYWDTPLGRMAVGPVLETYKMSTLSPRHIYGIPYWDIGPRMMIIVEIEVSDPATGYSYSEEWVLEPCAVPERGKWVIGVMPIEKKRGEYIIHPPALTTAFYSAVHTLYIDINGALRGEGDPLLMTNIAHCFWKLEEPIKYMLEHKIGESYPSASEEAGRAILEHLTRTTRIPYEIITKSKGEGFCDISRLQDFCTLAGLDAEAIYTIKPEEFVERLVAKSMVETELEKVINLISLKDLASSGENKPYETHIVSQFIDRYLIPQLRESLEAFIRGRLSKELMTAITSAGYKLNESIHVTKEFRDMIKASIRRVVEDLLRTLGMEIDVYMLVDFIMSQKIVLFHGMKTVSEILSPCNTIIPYELVVRLTGVARIAVTEYILGSGKPLTNLIKRITQELYDKPIYVLQEIYMKKGDILAQALATALETALRENLLDALEILKEKFGYKVEIRPQRFFRF